MSIGIREKPQRFDAYEVGLVMEQNDPIWGLCCSRINSMEEAKDVEPGATFVRTFWSLYGHVAGKGAICIGDFDTQQSAFDILYSITGIVGNPEQEIYKVPKQKDGLSRGLALDTLFDFTASYYNDAGKGVIEHELAGESHFERLDSLLGWAKDFVKQNEDTDWEKVDYFTATEVFYSSRIEELKERKADGV